VPANALEVRNGVKIFFADSTAGSDLLVLDDVSFAVRSGEFLSVLGPSGCGKTTLARIITGLDEFVSGEVLVDGAPPGPPGAERCLVFQNYGLLPWRTVEGNVELGMEVQGVGRAERKQRAREYLKLVGLTGFEKRYPHQISGGMQQRTGLARALATQPKMLIMDEPFGALDAQMRTLLQDELLRICEMTGLTVLFVTHSIDEAVYLSDRILVFSARPGRPVAELTVDLPRPRDEKARSSHAFIEVRKQVSDILAERTTYYQSDAKAPAQAGAAIHTD
jgi:NitT/TauT family transport system ATP-binding protein